MEISLYLSDQELQIVKEWVNTKIFHKEMNEKIDLGVSYGTHEYTKILSTNEFSNLEDTIFSIALLSELSNELNKIIEKERSNKKEKIKPISLDDVRRLFILSWDKVLLEAVKAATKNSEIKIAVQRNFDLCYTYILSMLDFLPIKNKESLSVDEVVQIAFDQMIAIIKHPPFEDGNKRTASLCFFIILEKLFNIKITLSNHRFNTLVKVIYAYLLDSEATPLDKVHELWVTMAKAEIYTLTKFEN